MTRLLVSIKIWKAPRADLEIPIEKTSVSSWVRTRVVAFFLKTAVGNDFDAESKLMTVSKWFRQWNDSMNYDFHHITILLASIKNWKAPPVDIAIAIEKTSVSSWVWTPVAAFLSERGPANENCHQNETEVNFISFTKTQHYFFEKPIGDFSHEAYNLTAGNSVRSKQASMAELLRRWAKVPMAKCPLGFEHQW